MKKGVLILLLSAFCVQITTPGKCQDEKKDAVKGLNYRQTEFFNQWRYLSVKETKIAEELNGEIALYNENAALVTLQRIEDLKIKIIENLQDQIKNDRDYISYLELKFSDIADQKFIPLMLKKDRDEEVEPIQAAVEPVPAAVATVPAEEAALPAIPEENIAKPEGAKEEESLANPEEAKKEESLAPDIKKDTEENAEDDAEKLLEEIRLNIKGLKKYKRD